jgi:hypothetical protein
MAKNPCRRPDHRRVKVHRSYTVEEAAGALGAHRNTVRLWIRDGLPLVDRKRPYLIRGLDLIAYLKRRRAENKRPCGVGQIYCLRCRIPQTPAGGMADYAARTDRTGDLIGLCPRCELVCHRRISRTRFVEVCGTLEVRIMQPHLHIADASFPSVGSDFQPGAASNAA